MAKRNKRNYNQHQGQQIQRPVTSEGKSPMIVFWFILSMLILVLLDKIGIF